VKQKADGSLDKFKACLVARGFQQQYEIDYSDTFSPVVKYSTIRAILALAIHFQWSTRQLDVSNAFLHGTLEEEVFMEQPQGFVDSKFPQHVCRLHKSIYGLKQAPRAWFHKLASTLLSLRFIESKVDYSLFIFHDSNVHIFLLVYVDNIIVTSNYLPAITNLITWLQQSFSMKDLGPLHYFLGVHVQHLPLVFACLNPSTTRMCLLVLRCLMPSRPRHLFQPALNCLNMMEILLSMPLNIDIWLALYSTAL